MIWYKKVLKENKKEMISGAVTTIVFSLILILWTFLSGKSFTWIPIEPIDAPSILKRYFYSAFTFSTIGAILYASGFYLLLRMIVVDIFGSWFLYNLIKLIVWTSLMYISYQYLVPFTVSVLNHICSFFFNLFHLALYLSPSLGITIILVVLYKFYKSNIRLHKTS
jgi:hypothetical protein